MIIGVTGSICSGTSTFMSFLNEKRFIGFSYSDILREELSKTGKEITRKNLQDIGDELRKKEGLGVLSRRMIEKMDNGKNYVVGNIRNPGEVEEFRKEFGDNFILIRLDADFQVRFDRARKRARENEPMELEAFKKMEERDLGENEEEHGQQHKRVIEMADFVIENNQGLGELKDKVDELLADLG